MGSISGKYRKGLVPKKMQKNHQYCLSQQKEMESNLLEKRGIIDVELQAQIATEKHT